MVRGSRILSQGHNRTHLHAEVDALRRLPARLVRGSVVVSVRLGRCGKLSLAAPCDGCLRYLGRVGVSEVWYSDAEGQMCYMQVPPEHGRVQTYAVFYRRFYVPLHGTNSKYLRNLTLVSKSRDDSVPQTARQGTGEARWHRSAPSSSRSTRTPTTP